MPITISTDPNVIAALETQLVSSRLQTSNPALYLTIKGLIDNMVTASKQIRSNTSAIGALKNNPTPPPSFLIVQMTTGASPVQPMFVGTNPLLIRFTP